MSEMAWKYEKIEKRVRAGESKIFQNWHENAGVSVEAFLDAVKWLSEDPMLDGYRVTREIGCKRNGELVKIRRVYDRGTGLVGFYELESGMECGGRWPSVNINDRF